jgi:hypothetical protein
MYGYQREYSLEEDIEKMRDEFLNQEFDEMTFDLDATRMAEYAKASGELDPKFTDPSHDDFQAPRHSSQLWSQDVIYHQIFQSLAVSGWMRVNTLNGWPLFVAVSR